MGLENERDNRLFAEDADEDGQDYTPDLIEVLDEDDETHSFEVLDAADIGDAHYLLLRPYFEDPAQQLADKGETFVVQSTEDGDDILYDLVEDDDELAGVMQVFLNRLSEVYHIDMDVLKKELEDEEKNQR